MLARIVIVHNDAEFLQQATDALRIAGYHVVSFVEPLIALRTLEAGDNIEILITRVAFGAGKQHGLSLAMMAQRRRPALRVIFTALPEFEMDVIGVGEFLPLPVKVPGLVDLVAQLLILQSRV